MLRSGDRWHDRVSAMSNAAQTVAAIGLTVALVLTSTQAGRTQQTLSALPTVAAAPADNPTTPDKVELGRLLFWDPILSGQQDVACATCHHPDFGYAENLDVSIGTSGIGLGASRRFAPGSTTPHVKRNSQTILNAAFNGIDAAGRYDPVRAPMFWDARVQSLEAQSLEPIKTLEEMRGGAHTKDAALDVVVARLSANADYQARFAKAFGGRDPVSATNLGRALAAFERTLVAANAPFDRYVRGDESAMTPLQVQGMRRFERAGCANCHSGPMFSDFKVHVLGIADNPKVPESDAGVDGAYAFRTATLRNLVYTAPYMHSGVFRTLDEVVQFYDNPGGRRRRGGATRNANVTRDELDPLLRQLNMRGGRRDLVAFLQALSDDSFDRTIPAAVPSGLTVGGTIQ
jgi:cytochrome c peroxidase